MGAIVKKKRKKAGMVPPQMINLLLDVEDLISEVGELMTNIQKDLTPEGQKVYYKGVMQYLNQRFTKAVRKELATMLELLASLCADLSRKEYMIKKWGSLFVHINEK